MKIFIGGGGLEAEGNHKKNITKEKNVFIAKYKILKN